MTTQLHMLLELLAAEPTNPEELVQACQSIDSLTPGQLYSFVQEVRRIVSVSSENAWKGKLTPVLMSLLRWARHHQQQAAANDERVVEEIVGFYHDLASLDAPRHHLLTFLTTLYNRTALVAMASALVTDPPRLAEMVCLPFVPLFKRHDSEMLAVFPTLLEALQNPHAAVGVLDLANYAVREGIAERHPAESRREQLAMLLEGVVRGLEQLEKEPARDSDTYRKAHQQIQQAAPLIVSLCDALGLIGDERAVPHLKHVMELRHRRLQVEAAAALVRLGDEAGIERLADLASEASVRLRVLRYADELEIEDQIDQQYQDPVAVAQSELVTCLADPKQIGFPPTSCELIDSRTLYWPGYEEPRICYLFRFHYQIEQGQIEQGQIKQGQIKQGQIEQGQIEQGQVEQGQVEQGQVEQGEQLQAYSSVGIAGPLTHVMHADLSHLPVESVYAAFAGSQAEHPLIFEIAAADWNLKQEHVAEDFLQRVGDAGYQDVQPLMLGYVLERLVLVATARRTEPSGDASRAGTVVVDDKEIHWYEPGNPQRPLGPAEAYCIDKGQQLLDSFN